MKKPEYGPCDVYISYHRKNGLQTAKHLRDLLEARGYSVFMDDGSLGAGAFSAVIPEQIRNCGDFILVCTPHALDGGVRGNDPMSMELRIALAEKKNVIPVMYDGFSLPSALSLGLGVEGVRVQTDVFDSAADRIISCVQSKPSGKKRPAETEKTPGKPGFFSSLFGRKKQRDGEKEPDQPAVKTNFSVLSPRAVKPDSYGIVDLYMYTEAQREAVEEAIRRAASPVEETVKKGFAVKENTAVSARLESPDGVTIKDPLDTQVWNGESLHFDFQFYLPADYGRSQASFTCYVEFNGIPVTRLHFLVAVAKAAQREAIPAKVTRSDYTKAFISYSRKDEQRMLSRVLGIKELAPQMRFWLDKQSMDAGDIWREEIKKAIQISDVLLLFWSVAASRSAEVAKEWGYALENRGLSFIAPVPLDPPDLCPPPPPLQSLNFSVRAFSMNSAVKQLSFYDSDSIEII